MPITINGSGTITGLSVGGLPDGCVDNDTIANSTIAAGKCSFTPGKILKVQSASAVNSQSLATTYTVTDVTGLSISYTPVASDSKLYVDVNVNVYVCGNGSYHGMCKFYLDFDGTQQGEEERFLGGYGSTTSYNNISSHFYFQREIDAWSGGSAKTIKVQARNETNSGQPCTINSEPGHSWLKITEVAA